MLIDHKETLWVLYDDQAHSKILLSMEFLGPIWRWKEMTDYVNMHLCKYMSVHVHLSRVFAFPYTMLLVVLNVIRLKI